MQRQSGKVVTIFGGTSFLGKHIVKRLAAEGMQVRVATRVPESAYKLKTCGSVGQIVPVVCDYTNVESISEVVRGSDFVVNCIGIVFEKRKRQSFQQSHVEIPAMIAKICTEEGVKRFVHMSALGCNAGISRYFRSKLEGEQIVLTHFPKATVLRPSLIFGRGDYFLTMFAELTRFLPFMPLIGGGITKLQPVYVGDVSDAAMIALSLSTDKYQSKTYQLGGPEVVDFKEICGIFSKYTRRERVLITIPYKLAKYYAWFLEFWPRPILTRDQINSLKTDSIVQNGALGLSFFGIMPKSVHLIVPEYLACYRVIPMRIHLMNRH